MRNAENVNKLKAYLKKLKKQKLNDSVVRTMMRVKALIAYYKGQSTWAVAECFDIHEKTCLTWIKHFEVQGCDSLPDLDRSCRPVKLPEDKQQELKQIIEDQNQRIWATQNVYVLLVSMFDVVYSIKYLPEFRRQIGLKFPQSSSQPR